MNLYHFIFNLIKINRITYIGNNLLYVSGLFLLVFVVYIYLVQQNCNNYRIFKENIRHAKRNLIKSVTMKVESKTESRTV